MLIEVISLLTHFCAKVCLATGSEHCLVYLCGSFQKRIIWQIPRSACVYVRTHAHVRVFLGIVNAEQVNQHISIGK